MERVAIILASCSTFVAVAVLVFSVIRLRRQVRGKRDEIAQHLGRLESVERMNRAFIHALPDLMFILDRNAVYLDYSIPPECDFKLPKEGLIGKKITDAFDVPEAHLFLTAIHDVFNSGGIRIIESDLQTSRGLLHFESRIVAMDAGRALCISRDITKRHEYEDALVRSLHEKEALIREVHHRVKNNIQIISSLIDLQADRFKDKDDRRLIQETQQQIHSMSHLHEILYQAGDFTSIDMHHYLTRIIDDLKVSHRLFDGHITVRNLVEPLSMSLEMAMPVGLIVNELVSNAFSYAFNGPVLGTVSVALRRESGMTALVVSDDGCGLPAGFDPSTAGSLGWVLVNSLVIQIGGRLTILPSLGTSVRIEIAERK